MQLVFGGSCRRFDSFFPSAKNGHVDEGRTSMTTIHLRVMGSVTPNCLFVSLLFTQIQGVAQLSRPPPPLMQKHSAPSFRRQLVLDKHARRIHDTL